jgi:hypothetical protein
MFYLQCYRHDACQTDHYFFLSEKLCIDEMIELLKDHRYYESFLEKIAELDDQTELVDITKQQAQDIIDRIDRGIEITHHEFQDLQYEIMSDHWEEGRGIELMMIPIVFSDCHNSPAIYQAMTQKAHQLSSLI